MMTIIDFTASVKRGTFGITLVTLTEPKMRKCNNPYYGRVHKATYMTNVALGYDYENAVNNRLERKGENPDFQAEKPKGKIWATYPYILQSEKEPTKQYLRCTMRPNTKAVSIYLLDGKEVSGAILDEIKAFMPKPTTSIKQAESGLSESEQVIVRDYSLESVMLLKQGEVEYRQISSDISLDMVKKIFIK